MDLTVLFDKMFIFLVLMAIGYFCARKGFMTPAFTKTASSLTINVFMSATILNAVLNTDMALSPGELGKALLVVCAMQLISYALAFLTARLPLERQYNAEFELLMSFGNNLFIALPIVDGLFGPMAVFYVSLSSIPFNLYLYTYGVWRLKSGSGEQGLRLKDILSLPLGATFIGLALVLLHPSVPSAVRGLIGSMAGATMPMSMLVLGASLGKVSPLEAFRRKPLYINSLVRLVLAPLVVWLLLRFVTQDQVLLMTAVITAACPSAVIVSVLAIQYGKSGIYTAEGILHSTVLSMLSIPLLVWLLNSF
ncbi:MAG: AEC family transporter [Oscillospiraceae bacterium]|nr:AEC family transporter [Oscillospiraceae bacterium]